MSSDLKNIDKLKEEDSENYILIKKTDIEHILDLIQTIYCYITYILN